MCKLFTFTIILSGILIAHVVCPTPPETKKPAESEPNQPTTDADDSEAEGTETDDGDVDDDDNQEEESAADDEGLEEESDSDEEAEPSLPFLTCSVFNDDFACNAMCSVVKSIYGTPITSGVCEEAKECECQISPNATLEDYWNEKFLAKNTLTEILLNKEHSKQILEVFKTPFRTAQQTIEDLKPHLSPKQLSNLRIKNKSAQKIFSTDGEFDKAAVQKYVASKLKSLEKPSKDLDYNKTLLDVLNNPDNKDIVDYIINEIRQSENKILNSAIEDYVKERGIQVQDPSIDSKDKNTIIDFLDTAVINELVKPPPRENALKLTGLRSKSKKSAAGVANKPNNGSVESSKKGTQSTPEIKPKSDDQSDPPSMKTPTIIDSRWTLEGFDKSVVNSFRQGTKQWQKPGVYSISMHKGQNAVWLKWNNEQDDIYVEINVVRKGDVEQKWSFDDGRIEITIRKGSGSQKEFWNFRSSRLSCTKGPDGKILQKRWGGPEDLETLEKSKKFIDGWCTQNGSLVGMENCVIY